MDESPRISYQYFDHRKALRLRIEKGLKHSLVEIYLFGAHVTRWEESGQPPFLFLSKKALLDGSKAIRRGIPVIFPQFSGLGPLPAHGFARNRAWQVASIAADTKSDDTIHATFHLAPSEDTNKLWNKNWFCEYVVTLSGFTDSRLSARLTVRNTSEDRKGEGNWNFTAALHTYFNIGDIRQTTITSPNNGLDGLLYRDNLQAGKELKWSQATVQFDRETDRIYLNTPNHLVIDDRALNRQIHVVKEGFNDAVLWNPWIEKAKTFSDFELAEYEHMVCVEAAAIGAPPLVEAGRTWTGSIELSVRTQNPSLL